VLSFNWVAAALCMTLVRLLKIGATNFYDDFTVIEAAGLAASTAEAVEGFFKLLGWALKPLPAFAAKAEPLGAILDLSECRQGRATLANRPTRVTELTASMADVLVGLAPKPNDLSRLRGASFSHAPKRSADGGRRAAGPERRLRFRPNCARPQPSLPCGAAPFAGLPAARTAQANSHESPRASDGFHGRQR